MRRLIASLGSAALLLVLAACQTTAAASRDGSDAQPRATALRLALTGKTEAVAAPDAAIPVELQREGADPLTLDYVPGALTIHELPPGRYGIAKIGPMSCTDLGFDVTPGQGPLALGTVDAKVSETDYYIGYVSGRPAAEADVATLGAEPGQPIVGRHALCHAPRDYTGPVWADLPIEQKLMFALMMAGFCALTVASGMVCAF